MTKKKTKKVGIVTRVGQFWFLIIDFGLRPIISTL